MKKLNKHPRLYKKMANALKKLITNKIKFVRLKMINGQNKNSLKANGTNIIQHHFLKPGQQLPNRLQRGMNNNTGINQINNTNDFSRIINVASFRKIPYNEFILRLTPYDYETYLKMIKMNYSCRLEVHITNIRSIKYILDVLIEKWRNIPKNEPKINLYLIPIRELWIPKELIFFSINDCDRIYDIGDIYTAYGSPSTNILHMKYQWSEEKINLNNEQNNDLSFNNHLSIQPQDSINDVNDSEYKPEQRLIKAFSKLESSNLLNRSHTINNQINYISNKAIKADESQDLFDLSELRDIEMGPGGESLDKKNINNITESINRNEDCHLFDYSQDLSLQLDEDLLDPMELLGFNNNDKKSDNLSNSLSNKVRTPSLSKKIHLRHKKISFVNNVKPTESMINSSFINKSGNNKNSTGLKLRTGYSEVFSNNNSNLNNVNNLAYTSNNNLSEVSSHINNSNHFANVIQGGNSVFSNQSLINKNVIKENNSNNKSKLINIENNSNNKNSILINNSIIEESSKDLMKESNIYNNSKNEFQNNFSNDNTSQRKKKKIKFVNNVSKENIQELKELQEKQKSKNNSSFFEKIEEKKDNNSNSNKNDTKKILFSNSNISFGKKIQNNQIVNNEKKNIKEENKKENQALLTPVKEKVLSLNNDDSPNIKNTNNNSNKKKLMMNNNHSNNWLYGMGGGLTRFIVNNNTNNYFGMNDTIPFFGQNTMNYNNFFDNGTLLKSNLNNTNLFHADNGFINEDNQLSQMMFMNRGDERTQPQVLGTSFIGNDRVTKVPMNNPENTNNNINTGNNNSNQSNQSEFGKINTSIHLNNNNEVVDKNLILGLRNDIKNDNDTKELLNKKRNASKEPKQKRNKKMNSNDKKAKKINNNILNKKNTGLKNPTFSNNNYNNINNLRTGNKEMNNNFPVNKQYYPPFPYNIDIPLPSRFFEESINNNYKK